MPPNICVKLLEMKATNEYKPECNGIVFYPFNSLSSSFFLMDSCSIFWISTFECLKGAFSESMWVNWISSEKTM